MQLRSHTFPRIRSDGRSPRCCGVCGASTTRGRSVRGAPARRLCRMTAARVPLYRRLVAASGPNKRKSLHFLHLSMVAG